MTDTKTRGAYRVEGEQKNKKRPVWLWLLAALALLALLLWALISWNTDTDSDPTRSAGSARSENGSSSGGSGDASGSDGQPGSTTTGSLTAGGTSLLPLSQAAGAGGDLSSYVGKTVRSTGTDVVSVPADEGFWVGSSQRDRVWVQLVGGATESGYRVAKGDKVAFNGTVVPHKAGFAAKVGVNPGEGASQLDDQKAHLKVEKGSVKLAR